MIFVIKNEYMKISDNKKNLLPSNRKFGILFSIIFIIFAFYFFLQELYFYSSIAFFLCTLLIIIIFVNDNILLPFNKLWMKFGMLIGKVVNPIIIGFIFFILFVPLSLIMKVLGRDEMKIKNTKKQTYWNNINEDLSNKSNFKNQF